MTRLTTLTAAEKNSDEAVAAAERVSGKKQISRTGISS